MYGILLWTRDHQARGVRGQLDQDRFGFAALIKHFGAEGEIPDKLERQEHLMLPVHLQNTWCSLYPPSDFLLYQKVLFSRVVHWKGRPSGHWIEDIDPNKYVLTINCHKHNHCIEDTNLKAGQTQFLYNIQPCGGEDEGKCVSLGLICVFQRRPCI